MDFWNGDLHTFLIYKILFLLHSFTRNILTVKNILGSPEKNKINDLCNLTFSVTQEEKKHIFSTSAKSKYFSLKSKENFNSNSNKSSILPSLSNQDFYNENKHHLGSWSTNGAGWVRRDRALPSASGGVVCGLGVCKGKETQRAKEGWRSRTCASAPLERKKGGGCHTALTLSWRVGKGKGELLKSWWTSLSGDRAMLMSDWTGKDRAAQQVRVELGIPIFCGSLMFLPPT